MGNILFILGGARSGKSSFATNRAIRDYKKVAYIATSPYYDQKMTERIEQHKRDRPSTWPTYEQTKDLHLLIDSIHEQYEVLLIDCLTLYVSNYILDNVPESYVQAKVKCMMSSLQKAKCDAIIVSNEVGLGVHPENEMALEFRDVAGRANQIVAKESDDVYFMVSGLPLKLKSKSNG